MSVIALSAWLLCGCGFFGSKVEPLPNINPQGVVKTAYSQVGKRYRSGGTSPQKGFDCSGLIWWAYRQHGVNVPRITTDQAKAGKAVPKILAKPGDIMVFRTPNSPRGLHTAIYAGKNTFIHSPGQGKKVCLDSLGIKYWRDKLIAVRRVAQLK